MCVCDTAIRVGGAVMVVIHDVGLLGVQVFCGVCVGVDVSLDGSVESHQTRGVEPMLV